MFWKLLCCRLCALLGATGFPRPGLAADAPPELGGKLVYAEELAGQGGGIVAGPAPEAGF